MAKTPQGFSRNPQPGIGANIANAALQAGKAASMKPLTKAQMAKMTPKEIAAYEAKRARINMRIDRKAQARARKAAKAAGSLELKKAEMAHTTIRQGLAELTGMGAEGVGAAAITRQNDPNNAVEQNVKGGLVEQEETDPDRKTEDGPVAYSKRGRREE